MKIERLSENQIRCTLNKSDLASRQLKISELAYGSDKAKELFKDMMQQASYELGFEADDIPLMIEAIPVSADCIILIVTKVDNPEELDTRFSRFSPSDSEDDYDDAYDEYEDIEAIEADSSYDDSALPTAREELDCIDNIDSEKGNIRSEFTGKDGASGADLINLFNKVRNYLNETQSVPKQTNEPAQDKQQTANEQTESSKPSGKNIDKDSVIIRIFSFNNFDDVNDSAYAVSTIYDDWNALYKNPLDGTYYLVLKRTRCSSIAFNKTCNILSEFGNKLNYTESSIHFFDEHYTCVIPKHAVQVISRI